MIGDLFPSARRPRAVAPCWPALPAGLIPVFLGTGKIVQAFGAWRAPFLVAVVPGLPLSLCTAAIREPMRCGAEAALAPQLPVGPSDRRLLSIRTLWWLTLAATSAVMSAAARIAEA